MVVFPNWNLSNVVIKLYFLFLGPIVIDSDSDHVISISDGEEMQLNICFQSDDVTVIYDDDRYEEDEVAEERGEDLEKLEVEYDEYDESEGHEDSFKTITTLDSCIQDSDDCDDDNE